MRPVHCLWMTSAPLALALFFSWAPVSATPANRIVDWAALNPAFAGATFVKDPETCRMCHEDSMAPYEHTMHAKALRHGATSELGDCESCHGPRSKHIEDPTADLAFGRLTVSQQGAVCLQCHEGGARMRWKTGAHHSGEVGCISCHTVMTQVSGRALLARTTERETCYTCHAEVRAETMKQSHHPVREGRMACSSCHNVHGGTESLLTKNTLNETCYTCHTDKRSPVLWEHAPVRESCANCHTPHGSTNRALLTTKDPFLCMSCHSYGGHVNLPRYNRTSNPYGNGCVNCHIAPHGSNHPSGAKLTR